MTRSPVTMPGAFSVTLPVSGGSTAYRVLVAEPTGPQPPDGFPVVYVLDADAMFGTIVDAIRMRCRRPDATGVGPAMVVGVSHTGHEDPRARRMYDYTPGPSTALDTTVDASTSTGGAAGFLNFLQRDLQPFAATCTRVNPSHQILIGHSLAGYFTLWALLAGRADFTTYVSISPSLWWNRAALADATTDHSSAPRPRTRVMLTVGEYEQRRAPWQPDGPRTDDAIERRAERQMVDAAQALAETLRRTACDVDFHEFAGEDHASVVTLSIARALRFALPPAALLRP